MQRVGQLRSSVAMKLQDLQSTADAKGCSSLNLLFAATVMGLVFCPMSIVAIACPYWNTSSDSISSSVSLWEVSMTVDVAGSSSETRMDLCGDEMQSFDDCGKIDALRFFTITSMLMSCTSCASIVVAFLPLLKSKASLRRNVSWCGAAFAAGVFLEVFLSICIAASVDVSEASLNGSGFVFLVLELFALIPAFALLYLALRSPRTPSKPTSDMAGVLPEAGKPATSMPSLLDAPSKIFVKSKALPDETASSDATVADIEQGVVDTDDSDCKPPTCTVVVVQAGGRVEQAVPGQVLQEAEVEEAEEADEKESAVITESDARSNQ